jgi:predicted Zn-dependent peptidase
MTKDYQYKKSLLENGIRVVSEKIPYVHSVSIGIWILAGTIDESIENNGVAHFVEHMVFKGTKKRSSLEIADSLEALGGHLNAFTGKELTCYYAHILDENIEIAVDVLSDLVLNPKLLTEDIEKEKRVVLEEISELDDTPDELIHEHFIESLFQPHPLSFSTLGKKSTIKSLGKKHIKDFIRENYTGNRIVISAAGNVEHETIVDLVTKYLSKLPKLSKRNKTIIPKEHFQKRYFENSYQQAHICIGRRSFSYSDPKRYAMLLLNTILGFGMSSRLFQNIREKHGLAYSIYSFSDFLEDTGIFGVYLGTDKDKIDLAIDLVLKELKQFKFNKIEESELNKRKNQLKGNLLLGLESTSNRMNRLARTEINYGDFFSIDSIITSIDKVTNVQISELADWLFQNEKLTTIIFKPS